VQPTFSHEHLILVSWGGFMTRGLAYHFGSSVANGNVTKNVL